MDQARGTSQEFPDEVQDLSRRLFQVLPTASARRERPVTSTPPGGSALLIVSLLALKVILTGSNNWYDHTDWAGAQLLTSPTPGLSRVQRRLRHRTVCPLPFPGQIIGWCGVTSSMGRRSTPASGIIGWGRQVLVLGKFQLSGGIFRKPMVTLQLQSIIQGAVPVELGPGGLLARRTSRV